MKSRSLLLIPVILLFASACSVEEKGDELLELSSGKVERIHLFESQFVSPRNVDVWLPEGYSDAQKYAVLYMHDGQMLFDSTASWNKQEWGVDEAMTKLLEDGEIRNTIVVGIWNTEYRHSEYFPQKPFESLPQPFRDSLLNTNGHNGTAPLFQIPVASDKYLRFIVEELKPFIDQKYSAYADRQHTFIAGSSMGGLISMYAICEYPAIFYGAACLSTHWPGIFDTLNNPIPVAFVKYLESHLPDAENHLIYFDYGTETLDALYEPYQALVDSVMERHHYDRTNWKTLKFEGENHSERAWNKRLSIPLHFLLKQ